jgi:DNA-directed RNA polymerase II subunit RPB1
MVSTEIIFNWNWDGQEAQNLVYYSRWLNIEEDLADESGFVMKISVSREELFRKKLTMLDLYNVILGEKAVISSCATVLMTSENSADASFYFFVPPEEPETVPVGDYVGYSIYKSGDFATLKKIEAALVSAIVCGVEGIASGALREITHKEFRDDRIVDCKEYVIDTEGSNIPDIMALSFVDKSRTQTNDIRAIYKHYGVEAAKAAIIREINGVMTFNGVYVDLRHIRLIADQMTYKGVLAAINRHGQKLTEASPLMKSSFECTVQTLVKSGVRSAIDNMNGITPNVMIGQTARFGTNFAEYQMDY